MAQIAMRIGPNKWEPPKRQPLRWARGQGLWHRIVSFGADIEHNGIHRIRIVTACKPSGIVLVDPKLRKQLQHYAIEDRRVCRNCRTRAARARWR